MFCSLKILLYIVNIFMPKYSKLCLITTPLLTRYAGILITNNYNYERKSIMAKKYTNFRIGGSPQKVTDDYTVWSNDLLQRIIASKTVIQPGKSTIGHKLIDSDVVYIITNGRGTMEVVEYMNSDEGHGSNPSYGIEHKDSYELSAGDVVLVESGDYCKVVNDSDHDQLTYLRIFDRGGWRQ